VSHPRGLGVRTVRTLSPSLLSYIFVRDVYLAQICMLCYKIMRTPRDTSINDEKIAFNAFSEYRHYLIIKYFASS